MANTPETAPMNVYLAWTLTIVWWIVYPICIAFYYTASVLSSIAKQLYRPVGFLLQPVIYLGRFILACLIAPFQFLARFETLYIYLGVAAITGILGGIIVSLIYGSLRRALGLEGDSEPPLPRRTAKQYRKSKRKQNVKEEAPLMTSGILSPGPLSPGYHSMSDRGGRGRGLLSQTIMEEMDSDY